MTSIKRDAADLAKNPFFAIKSQPDPPVSVAMGHLVVPDGDRLEEMTRVKGPAMIRAMSIGYIYSHVYGSQYVAGRITQAERVAISIDGLGRREIIDVVDAGGNLPEGYYNPEGKRQFMPLGDQ